MRHLHRLLRRLGQGHDLRARDEAGPAVPLPRRGLLHHLRAPPGGPLPEFFYERSGERFGFGPREFQIEMLAKLERGERLW